MTRHARLGRHIGLPLLLLWATSVARGDRIDNLIKQIGSTNDEQRADAVEMLTQVGGARVEKQFRQMLESKNAEQRQMAVVGLL
ncbi:MAG: hypothetical protein ABSA97_08035, partial [Verrucomicrobiia bacterium]